MAEDKIFGYCRTSTKDQNIEKYVEQLEKYGIPREDIYYEKVSGGIAPKDRPELSKLLKVVRAGDTIVIESLSRLGRSTKDLIETAELLQEKGVELKSLKEDIDTKTATGKAMFGMLAVMSQFERDQIRERTKFGLEYARARGRVGGRKKTDIKKLELAKKLYDSRTMTVKEICASTGVSRNVLYTYIREVKEKNL